jgi:DNA-binding transcriptional regulator GbsR (MarR family)
MPSNLDDAGKTFVEEVGVVFEKTGLPRMAGRVFGWLLISDPPYQSPAELSAVLMASKGSISTTVRLLIQIGLIDRYVIPGIRHDYFLLRGDALQKTIRHGLEDEIKMFLNLAERGLELMTGEPSIRREWLVEMHERYIFLEQEFPAMMERYEKHRAGGRTSPMLKG